jgi:hypothetical protein
MTHYQYKNTSFVSTLCTGVKNRRVTSDEEPKESVRVFLVKKPPEKKQKYNFSNLYIKDTEVNVNKSPLNTESNFIHFY